MHTPALTDSEILALRDLLCLAVALRGREPERARSTSGWLIERTHHQGVRLPSAEWLMPAGESSYQWGTDANAALRFVRQQDAEAFIGNMLAGPLWNCTLEATDHQWCAGPDLNALDVLAAAGSPRDEAGPK